MVREESANKNILKEKLRKVIKEFSAKVDYFDIRVGGNENSLIEISQKKVKELSRPRSFGGSVRAYHKGGWGFAAFSEMTQLEEAAKKAIFYARRVGSGKSCLANVPKVTDTVKASLQSKDFTEIPLSQKTRLMNSYDQFAWSQSKYLVNVDLIYIDSLVWKTFTSTDKSLVEEERAYVFSNMSFTAERRGVIQEYRIRLSDANYKSLFGKEEEIKEAIKTTELLAVSPPVKSGSYTVVVDPKMAGLFAHEGFGHLSEADNVYEDPQLFSVMKLGRKMGSPILTIIDDPTIPGLRGSYTYDDEGVAAQKQILLDRGVLVGRLHSRETAGKLDEAVNGHARAQSVRIQPIVRMGATYIKPGKSTFSQLLAGIKDGLYCVNWIGGETDHERFTFTAGYGVKIKNGKLGSVVRDVKLTGNLFETLKNVDMVGCDLEFEGGTCGKAWQMLPNTTGGPHIRIQNVAVIGI